MSNPDPYVVDTPDHYRKYQPEELVEVRFTHGHTENIERLTVEQADALQASLNYWLTEFGLM